MYQNLALTPLHSAGFSRFTLGEMRSEPKTASSKNSTDLCCHWIYYQGDIRQGEAPEYPSVGQNDRLRGRVCVSRFEVLCLCACRALCKTHHLCEPQGG